MSFAIVWWRSAARWGQLGQALGNGGARCVGLGLAALLLVCLGQSVWVPRAAADARSNYLIRLLSSSSQFRVRAQAAISLGNMDPSAEIVEALKGALEDNHPAVRAAAAESLGRVGDRSAIDALAALRKDREGPVRSAVNAAITKLKRSASQQRATREPSAPARYYLYVGSPESRVDGVDKTVLEGARAYLQRRVSEIDGVLLAPDGESKSQAKRVLSKRRLKGYYLDSAVTKVEAKPGGGPRVVVSVIVGTYPGRDMRAVLNGAATAIGGGSKTYNQAVHGAFNAALRQLPQALGL